MGFLHGGGGRTRTSSTVDGPHLESRGMYRGGPATSSPGWARAWNDSLFHDFWYLPLTVGLVDPNAFLPRTATLHGWADRAPSGVG